MTVIPGAPGFYHHLMAVEDAEVALATVRLFTSGNAPLNATDFAAIRSRFGRPVWEGYGVSESASVVTTSLMMDAPVHGSVGRPLSGIQVRVLGPDGQDMASAAAPEDPEEPPADDPGHDPLDTVADAPDAGEVGRIAIRGATLFSGYWPNGGGGPDAEGWFVTGDVGFLDDDGQLHLVDRAAEVIVVSGFTVYPREIEDVLADHPDVAEVAVIGVPGRRGHGGLAAVSPRRRDGCPRRRFGRVRRRRLPRSSTRRSTTWWTRCPGPRSVGSTATRCVAGSARPPSRRCRRWSPCPTPNPKRAPRTPTRPSPHPTSPRNPRVTWMSSAPGSGDR